MSCVVPGQSGQEWHLLADPHRLLGDVLKTTVQLLSIYELKTTEELEDQAHMLRDGCAPIEGLTSTTNMQTCSLPEYT